MAYNPNPNLYNPGVAPNTTGYGPGLAAGMSNFSNLVSQGINAKRQDERDQKIWNQTLTRDGLKYGQQSDLIDKRQGLMDKKEEASKQDLSDYTSGGWETIKNMMPGLVTPELNEKFYGGNANTKNALFVMKQKELDDARKSQMAANEMAAKAKAANTWNPVPVSDTEIVNDQGSIVYPKKPAPQAGFQDLGNGTGAVYGPDGKPMNPAYLLKQGPAGMEPALPRQIPIARPERRVINEIPHTWNPQRNVWVPDNVQSGTGNPNASLFQ